MKDYWYYAGKGFDLMVLLIVAPLGLVLVGAAYVGFYAFSAPLWVVGRVLERWD